MTNALAFLRDKGATPEDIAAFCRWMSSQGDRVADAITAQLIDHDQIMRRDYAKRMRTATRRAKQKCCVSTDKG